MNAAAKLAGFAAVLALAFGGAALAGAAVDPGDPQPKSAHAAHGADPAMEGMAMDSGGTHAQGSHGGHGAAATTAPRGLAVNEGGYALEVDRTRFEPGRPARFSFRITDARGRVVRDEFQREHAREMHLIVVRRDTAVYRHLHPHRGRDGTWSVALSLPTAGVYRAYADFQVGDRPRTLATDLFAPGDFRAAPLPRPSGSNVIDGYEVQLHGAPARAGREADLRFAVSRDGRPVRGLQDYLGAKGHLVALREGDLAYLHVHPTGGAPAGEVPFAASFPTAGRYRLFLQFKAEGRVHTVDYTLGVRR